MTKEEFKTLKRGDIISNKHETHKGSICGYDYLVISDYRWDKLVQDGYIECCLILDNTDNSEYQKHCGKQFIIYETDIINCLNMHIKSHKLMKNVKFEFELPKWVLVIIYILECSAFGAILGVIVGLLLS